LTLIVGWVRRPATSGQVRAQLVIMGPDSPRRGGAKALIRQVDVTQEWQVSASFADAAQEFGSITTLVNSAGIEGLNEPTISSS
jgi:NAD(P)-dependent dehydrogenase (short-subunit alcohol dehydrogenase family)